MRAIPKPALWAALTLVMACSGPAEPPAEVELGGTSPEAAGLIRNLHAAATAEPGDAAARGELAMALEANGLPRAALETYRQAEALDPADPRWPYFAAVVAAQFSEFDDALAAVDRSLARDGAYVPAHLYRGTWLLDLGRPGEALSAFERANDLDPDNRSALYGRARAHLQAGNGTQAVELLRDRGDDPYLQQLLGLAYRQTGDLERSAPALAAGRGERPPRWPDPHRARLAEFARGYAADKQRADAYIQAGRWAAAVEILEPLLDDHGGDPDLRTNLALAYRNTDRVDDSIRVILAGLRDHPDHVHLQLNLGVAYEQQGRYAEALERYDRAIALNPNLAVLHQRRAGILMVRMRRLDEAVEAYERAWGLDPQNDDALAALTVALMNLGDYDRAEMRLTELERRMPGSAQVARVRAELERRR